MGARVGGRSGSEVVEKVILHFTSVQSQLWKGQKLVIFELKCASPFKAAIHFTTQMHHNQPFTTSSIQHLIAIELRHRDEFNVFRVSGVVGGLESWRGHAPEDTYSLVVLFLWVVDENIVL